MVFVIIYIIYVIGATRISKIFIIFIILSWLYAVAPKLLLIRTNKSIEFYVQGLILSQKKLILSLGGQVMDLSQEVTPGKNHSILYLYLHHR